MAGDKIGVQMSEEHVFDVETVLGGKSNVLVDVALRVDDGRDSCGFVTNQVGSMRQTRQIKLLEDHRASIIEPAALLSAFSPPAMAPMMKKGSVPDAMAAGKGASGDSRETSSEQAKKRKKARRSFVTWSRMVPHNIG
jgi:hypothetical protein